MPITCLVLDCDGVILESMNIKTQAMAMLAAPYGHEAVDRLVLYHTLHGGVNRRQKFIWFFEEVLEEEYTEEILQQWNARFEDMTVEAVKTCALVPGIEEVLQKWHGKLPIYVCSGASHDELNMILQYRGLGPYFTGIYGAPPAKAKLLQDIVNKAKVLPEEVLMVGDAFTDLHAAEEVGTLFYGRGKTFEGGKWPYAEDMTLLHEYLVQHAAR